MAIRGATTPLRNQDLARLKGLTCVAVVYDSDINMSYEQIYANLQGERYGLFSFTVLEVQVPYRLPETQSDTSLYELCMRVEPPQEPGLGFEVDVHDHEPDAVEIKLAVYSGGTLTVHAESDFAPGTDLADQFFPATMTVSVDGLDSDGDGCFTPFLLEVEMMMFNADENRHEFEFDTGVDLRGRHLSIQSDHGGTYNAFIE